jgi:hypothetical protein
VGSPSRETLAANLIRGGWVLTRVRVRLTLIEYKSAHAHTRARKYTKVMDIMSDIGNPDIMTTLKTALDNLFSKMAAEGENHTTVRDMIDKVVAATGVKVSIANGVVPLLLQEWQEAGHGQVLRGRRGGIWLGGRKQRVDMRPRCESCHQVLRPIGSQKGEVQ